MLDSVTVRARWLHRLFDLQEVALERPRGEIVQRLLTLPIVTTAFLHHDRSDLGDAAAKDGGASRMPASGGIRYVSPSELPRFRHIEVTVFIIDRPIAAVLAALATSAVFAMLDLLLHYATR